MPTRSILLIAAILLTHVANAQDLLTLQCMQLEPIVISPTCPLCDGSIELSVTGGQPPYAFFWNTADTTQVVLNLCGGEYSVTVTDANGCTVESSYIIFDPDPVPLTVVATGNAVSCFGSCDGSFDPSDIFGGPWEYYILNSPVDLLALCAGEYVDVLTGYAYDGCPTIFTVIINPPEPLEADVYVTPASCSGACDGQIELDVSGGTPPYSYSPFTGLCEGLYSIFVSDADGCVLEIEVFIFSKSGGPSISDILITSETSGQGNGIIEVIAGGFSPLLYSLNNRPFQPSNIFTGLVAGFYLVRVKDINGCIVETEVEVQNITAVDNLSSNFLLYPNPVNTYLHLESDLPCSIELVDTHGQMIRHADKAKFHHLNVEDIIPGLYLLRISDESGTAYRRVIVQ